MKIEDYRGFEQGPIRPPSESGSLLLRLTRNCPWNRCSFCPVYKGKRFSLRPVEHIIRDIDTVHGHLETILREAQEHGRIDMSRLNLLFNALDSGDRVAFNSALNWYSTGMKSIFFQDANSLIMKPDDLVHILEHIRMRFPMAQRITSYARSHTVARIKEADMRRIAGAGLNRIHIGLESGSDKVLEMINKGCTKAMHIKAGQRVKEAGMELSEYVMPGLGGVDLSTDHALETADALNQINADFIRLRTLAIPERAGLSEDQRSGRFRKCTDLMMARELRLFLEHLDGITSCIKSDHILNLLEEVEGTLPGDKQAMLAVVDRFLELPPQDRVWFQVGRRMGLFRGLDDMADPGLLRQVQETCRLYGVTPETVDTVIDELMKRFV
ncbi:MAG: radical SAM protein [Pseudomonadota bacterium]